MAVPPPAAAAAATGSKVRGSDRRLFTQGDGGQLRGMSHVKAVTRQRPVPAVCMHSVCMPRCQAVQPAAASTPSTAAQEKVSMDPRAALAAELRAMIEEKVATLLVRSFLICPRAESVTPFCVPFWLACQSIRRASSAAMSWTGSRPTTPRCVLRPYILARPTQSIVSFYSSDDSRHLSSLRCTMGVSACLPVCRVVLAVVGAVLVRGAAGHGGAHHAQALPQGPDRHLDQVSGLNISIGYHEYVVST